jgi:hypothetical protein
MAHYGPLGGASVAMVEVENMEKAAIAAELELAFGENPATSDGAKCAARPDDEDIPSEGAPDNEGLCMYISGHQPSLSAKLRKWRRKVTLRRTRLAHPGTKLCHSQTMTKLWCTKISLSPVCACLCFRP